MRLIRKCPACYADMAGNQCVCGYRAAPERDYALALPNCTVLNQRYILLRVLGAGGFGVTYQAKDMKRGGYCAVKEYVPVGLATRNQDGQLLPENQGKRAVYFHGMQRFLEEAYILQKLRSFPAIVTIFDCFEENGTAYFAMEYVYGTTVKAQVVSAGKLPVEEALRITAAVAGVLDRIYKTCGVFHRDISPENIMLSKDGAVKLLDFGSAKFISRETCQNFTVVLKDGYAPPEQYSSTTPQGPYTDVYALASTFYYMVTGSKIPSAMARVAGKTYMSLCDMLDVPQYLSEAVDHALRLSRKARTQDCEAFLRELRLLPTVDSLPQQILPASHSQQSPSQKDSDKAPPQKARIRILYGATSRTELIAPERFYRVGRSERCEICLPEDLHLSKIHCYLFYSKTRRLFAVKDISRNGILVGSQKLPQNQFVFFRHTVQLSMPGGSYILELIFPEDSNSC